MVTENQSHPIYVVAAHPNCATPESTANSVKPLPLPKVWRCVTCMKRYGPTTPSTCELEQEKLAAARLVVLVHPVQRYSMPALLKLWLDEVLSYGWAYGHGAKALQGKDLWLVASTGGPEASYRPQGYNRYFFDAFPAPTSKRRLCAACVFCRPWCSMAHIARRKPT